MTITTANELGDETGRAWQRVGELQEAARARVEGRLDLIQMHQEAHDGRYEEIDRQLTAVRAQLRLLDESMLRGFEELRTMLAAFRPTSDHDKPQE